MAGAGATIKQVLDAAEQAAKAGDAALAVALYRQVLTKAPKHTKAKKALARLQKQGGATSRAMTQADANALLQVLNSGDFGRARQLAEEMSRAFPNEPFVFNILGYASGMTGDQKGAIDAYKWAIKLNPNFVEAMSNYGSYLVQIGRPADAVPVLQKAVTKKPDYAEGHHNLGIAFAATEQPESAMQHYDLALRHAPRYANALNSRGTLKSSLNDREGAEADFRAAVELDPKYAGSLVNLGNLLSENGKSAEAVEVLKKAVALDPRNVGTLMHLGIVLNESNENEAALKIFRKVREIEPKRGKTLRLMLDLVPAEERAELVERIQQLFDDPATPEEDKVQLGFALGHYYEKQAAYERSYSCLEQANSLYRAALPPLPQTDAEKFDRITELFDKGALKPLEEFADPSTAPVFVLGMMRSGTSLVEQIIATHSAVYGAGELNTATDLAKPIYAMGSKAGEAEAQQFTRGYLRDLMRNAGDARHVVDKMPGNFFNVGLIRTLFPNARIVNTVRDPRDNCFSIYKNFFDTYAHQYAYDQGELAHFANRYKAMMNRWDELFPGAVYHIRYEALVADQEAESRKLLEYLGLPWEDGVLDFHKTKRAVRTASVNQVRQKIYRSSVKSWQNYEPFLQELFNGLDADLWADAFVQ